jgi:hypothetical protein
MEFVEQSDNYEYDFLSFLNNDPNIFYDTDEYSDILLCVYSVDNRGKYPFLKYLLMNSGYNTLMLPRIPIYNSLNKNNLISYSKLFLSGLLLVDNFEEFNNSAIFNGFYVFENKLYLFYDITKCNNIMLNETYSNSNLKFGLIDEITNTMNICHIPIDYETTKFFILNEQCNYLQDKNGHAYEIPIVGYVGKQTEQKLNFTLTFGETAKDKTSILGPYFYFTSFNRSIRQGGWSPNFKPEKKFDNLITDNEFGRYIKGGIVRFALFTGKTKYTENFPNDRYDESLIKRERLEDETLNRKYEILTLRISDHDGLWTHNYDSVYLGKIELDDGSFLEDAPIIVLKDYNQQIPLTYHYIDKKKLGDMYDATNNRYAIM